MRTRKHTQDKPGAMNVVYVIHQVWFNDNGLIYMMVNLSRSVYTFIPILDTKERLTKINLFLLLLIIHKLTFTTIVAFVDNVKQDLNRKQKTCDIFMSFSPTVPKRNV